MKIPLLKIRIEYKKLKEAFGVIQFKNHKRNEYTVLIDPSNRIKDQSYTIWHEFFHLYMRLLEIIALQHGVKYKNKFASDAGYLMNIGIKKEEDIAHRIAQCVENELRRIKIKTLEGRMLNERKAKKRRCERKENRAQVIA